MKSFLISAVSVASTVTVLYAFLYFNPWVKLMTADEMGKIVFAYNRLVMEYRSCISERGSNSNYL